MYDVFCAVYYVLKSGWQWQILPSDFPKWETVYFYFNIWEKEAGVNKESIRKIVLKNW